MLRCRGDDGDIYEVGAELLHVVHSLSRYFFRSATAREATTTHFSSERTFCLITQDFDP
jgi:hypothetical protein